MALTYDEYAAKRPVDAAGRARINAHKERMLAEVRAYRLRELREQAGFTQAQLAERMTSMKHIAMAAKNTCSWRPCAFSTGYQVELMPSAVDESA